MSVKSNNKSIKSYTYEYFSQDNVCRICWSENGAIELSYFTNRDEKKPLSIAEKITEYIGINVSLNSFPTKICKECLDKVEAFSCFKDLFHENEKHLTEILQKGYIEIEMEQPKREASELVESYNPLSDSSCELIIDYEEHTGSTELNVKSRNIKKEGNLKINKKGKVIRKTPTYCLICKIDFLTKDKMVEHNSEVHHLQNDLFQCFGCEKKYALRRKRFRHENYFCKFLKQGYFCEKCDTFLPTRKIWEQHYVAHKNNLEIPVPENLFKCRICNDKAFKSMQLLNDHKKYHTEGPDKSLKYVCETCGRTFARRDYFNKHQMSHNGLKPHKCPQCDFSCVQKSTLTVHLRKHTGERPYACVMCDKRFSTSSNLLKHNKHHLGVKQFKCHLCEKKFSYKQSLEEHLASVHNRSVTYSCEQCPSTFVIFRSLKRHLAKKHNINIDKKTFKQ